MPAGFAQVFAAVYLQGSGRQGYFHRLFFPPDKNIVIPILHIRPDLVKLGAFFLHPRIKLYPAHPPLEAAGQTIFLAPNRGGGRKNNSGLASVSGPI